MLCLSCCPGSTGRVPKADIFCFSIIFESPSLAGLCLGKETRVCAAALTHSGPEVVPSSLALPV